MRQNSRAIRWGCDATETVLRKISAADGQPGVLDRIGDDDFHLFGAHPERWLRGHPGQLIARRHGAICRATVDGAVWISHLKQRCKPGQTHIKLPAVTALTLSGRAIDLPEVPASIVLATHEQRGDTYREIVYEEARGVGYLSFDFYNGAMSTEQALRLRAAFGYARSRRSTKAIVLTGGRDFFSTGIHLNVIEAAADPAGESWDNLNAINDVVRDIVLTDSHYTVAALCGDAAAGGIALALAADRVVARQGIVLNPYYEHMGGLYGSEYWTYLLPRRVGNELSIELTGEPFTPLSPTRAVRIGLIDDAFCATAEQFHLRLRAEVEHLVRGPHLRELLELKRQQRASDERVKPLERYREEELARCYECFFGPDPSYHEARRRFTRKQQPAPRVFTHIPPRSVRPA
jgi:putative two-component system hydrogenase maturation factor HypX/HoxX